MLNGVNVVTEGPRGCGHRKVGGKYFVTDGISMPCPALPLEVSRCPCCDAGIKPTRSFAWFSPARFFKFPCPVECSTYQERGRCEPFQQDRAGIMWVGAKFYPTPEAWASEAKTQGVSKRISQVPKDFVVGETWIFIGHRKAIVETCSCVQNDAPELGCEKCKGTGKIEKPGVFHAFKPTRIEIVIDETYTQEKVDELIKKGFTPVIVNRVDAEDNPVDQFSKPVEDTEE